ncbi:MAG TPA: hypothetical protein VLA34_08920, partial [Candidatus Krumholzibacterium sp.]|nr:hypothetical protein [Candidatus Krumholzibacterium sp.]
MGKDSPRAEERRGPDPATMLDSASKWRKGLTVTVFLVLILCMLMPELVFQSNIFLVPDTKAPISFSEAGRQELERGTYPLWNPYIFGGMPSFQSLSYTPYVYPVAFLTFVLQEYLRFPEMTWLLVHYLMAGIGVYLLLRSFGARSSVSLLGGMIFMMMPNYLAIGANGHGSQACAIAYMPFALLFARNILSGRDRLLNGGLLALVLGFQTLRGHIQISYYTYLMIGLLVLFQAVHMLRSGKAKRLALDLSVLAGALIVSVGMASILMLPVREYADYSIRGGGGGGGLDYDYATGWSLHPGEMATFVFPWASGFGKATYWGKMPFTDYPNYLGMVTVVFAVISMTLSRNRWKWFILTAAVLSTLISFGRHFPLLYDPLFRFLPYFNKFRVPVMILIVQQLVLVVLAGMGIDEYLARREAETLPAMLRPARLKWLIITAVVALIIVLVASGAIRDGLLRDQAVVGRVRSQFVKVAASGYANDLVRTVFILAASVFVLFFAALKKVRSGVVVLALALVALLDMYTVAQPVLRPDKGWNTEGYRIIRPLGARDEYKRDNRAAAFLAKDDSYFRVFPVPYARPGTWSHNAFPFSDNSYMMSGIFSMGGYHAAKLKNYQDVMDVMFASFNSGRLPKQILDMMNAKYFISL